RQHHREAVPLDDLRAGVGGAVLERVERHAVEAVLLGPAVDAGDRLGRATLRPALQHIALRRVRRVEQVVELVVNKVGRCAVLDDELHELGLLVAGFDRVVVVDVRSEATTAEQDDYERADPDQPRRLAPLPPERRKRPRRKPCWNPCWNPGPRHRVAGLPLLRRGIGTGHPAIVGASVVSGCPCSTTTPRAPTLIRAPRSIRSPVTRSTPAAPTVVPTGSGPW